MVALSASADRLVLTANDGVALAAQVHGRLDDPPLILSHGFGQTRQAWTATADRLAVAGLRCIALDSRGHGDSGWLPGGRYEIDQFVDDLVLAARMYGPDAILVGASMGGLTGLLAEAERGPLFRALVLVDITPRWETAGVERILAFMRAHPDGFASPEEAAEAIATYLPQRAERKSPERLKSLLVRRDDGRWRWHWDPLLLDRISAEIDAHQERLIAAAKRIAIPTLLLSGGDSDVVSQSTIAEFLELVPHARHVVVPGATHMIVGDRNEVFTDAVLNFVRTFGPTGHF